MVAVPARLEEEPVLRGIGPMAHPVEGEDEGEADGVQGEESAHPETVVTVPAAEELRTRTW